MSDYIERLRGELLRAGATKQHRVRVPSFKPALALAAAAAIVVVVVIALPQRSDEREAAGTTASYRVEGDVERTAEVLRHRLAAAVAMASLTVDGDTVRITAPGDASAVTQPGRLAVYDLERGKPDRPAVDNAAIASAEVSEDPTTGEPVVLVKLTKAGQEEFSGLTKLVAERGADREELQHVAIAVDGRVYSEPYIDWRVAPSGIDGSEGIQISDGFTAQQARELAAVLDSGPLPGKLISN